MDPAEVVYGARNVVIVQVLHGRAAPGAAQRQPSRANTWWRFATEPSNRVDERFDRFEGRIESIETRVDRLESEPDA